MATKKAAKKTATKTTRSVRAAGAAADTNPRYRVLQLSFIDNVLYNPGQEVTYFGLPGRALQPLNAEAKSRKQQVRDIRLDPELDADEKLAAFKVLSDEWNGVEEADDWGDDDEEVDDTDLRLPNAKNTKPLPAAERIELEKHATATVEATEKAQREDTNFTKVKLMGSPNMVETDASKQGATPVTDGREK